MITLIIKFILYVHSVSLNVSHVYAQPINTFAYVF